MPQLQPLRADHARAVLAFELVNREYFARSVSDRGNEFFDRFEDQHAERLAEQREGRGAYYVLVENDDSVVGRVNLILTGGDTATLGYRVAELAAGRGVATDAVRQVCELAAGELELHRLVASTTLDNLASQRVLEKAGFLLVGPAHPDDVGGKPGYRFERRLA